MRIPFDGVALAAVVSELSAFEGAKVQRIVQPDDSTITVELYGGPELGVGNLLLCCHAEMYRAHLVTRRYRNAPGAPAFCTAVRSNWEGLHLRAIRQIQGDRLLELVAEDGSRLIAELMGKHSNLILVDGSGKTISAAKWIGRSKSVRPITPGRTYELPPVMVGGGGLSPFAKKLVAAGGSVQGDVRPVLSPGNGAYPFSVAALGLPELPRPSFSIALEQHYDNAVPAAQADLLRASLVGELKRVLLAREVAIADLHHAVDSGARAGELQREGELILAYGGSLAVGASILEAWDYEGQPVTLRLNPELDFKENAAAYFARARKAKDRLEFAREQLGRLEQDHEALLATLEEAQAADELDRLESLHELAKGKRWLHERRTAEKPEDRPFEGHRVRELTGPGGVRVLYGENAESNDYLTLRVARPNDYWLHIRGGTSAHVVIATNNQPDRIGPEALLFAAKVCVKHSPSKHAGIVAVDYTLKKYVRKQRGAAKGSALYTHEKTLHVSQD